MASKQRYRKLCLGPGGSGERVTARNSVIGMTVVGDYVSPADAQRYLLLERPDAAAPSPAAKVAARPRRKARKVNAQATPSPVTDAVSVAGTI